MSLTLEAAQTIIAKTFEHRKANDMKPLGAVIMDTRGVVRKIGSAEARGEVKFDTASVFWSTEIRLGIIRLVWRL